MSTDIFNERLKRIAKSAPDAHIVIPGQVGEPERKQVRAKRARVDRVARRRESTVTSILFGGICGAVAGLVFNEVIGIQTLLALDWQAELALLESDRIRAAAWGIIAAGATAVLLTYPTRKRFRKLAGGSLAYMAMAIGVNAQEFIALVPTTGAG